MDYVYDILLNYSELNSYYEYYEWKKDDHFINVRKAPILRVNTSVISDFINYKIIVDKGFVKEFDKKCLLYKKDLNFISNVVILSNCEKSIGVSFNKNGQLIYISSMLLDEENEINKIVKDMKIHNIRYIKKGICDRQYFRLDNYKRKRMISEIKKIYLNKNYEKLKYFYYVLFDTESDDIELVYKKLLNISNEKLYNFF